MSTDREMVQAVLAGVPRAFERLVREHQGLCAHIIQRMVWNADDTRELCQETFLRVHRCLHQYRFDSALKSWIGQIAYSIALRFLEKRRLPLADAEKDGEEVLYSVEDDADLEASYSEAQTAGRLNAAIERLPPLQRTVLTLYHVDELSIPEIAGITGLAAGTIKSHLFRTRLRLREALQNSAGDRP